MTNTSQKFIQWGGLLFVCGLAWQLTGSIDKFTAQLMLGVLLGTFVGIAFAAIALAGAQSKRVDVHHQHSTETPREPQQQLPAPQHTQYRVVESDVIVLPGSAHPRIEVSR